MASFTLTFQDEDGTVTKTFNAVFINEVVDHFDSFLRGCGYVPDGELGILKEEPLVTESFLGDSFIPFNAADVITFPSAAQDPGQL